MKVLNGISRALLPHKDKVGGFAGIVTILHFLSGTLLCNDIRKRGTARDIPFTPFLGGLVLSVLSVQFGVHMRDETGIKVNLIGFALSTIYCVIYYWYTPNEDKTKIWGKLGMAGAFTAALLAYCQYEDPKLVEFRFGMILTGLLLCVIAAPLLDLPEIVRKQSTEGMPLPMIVSGTVVSTAWLMYGVTLNNDFLIYQNVVAVAICAIQLSLFAIYPATAAKKGDDKKKKN